MGFVGCLNGWLLSGALYIGWVDNKSREPVDDKDVRGHYKKCLPMLVFIWLVSITFCTGGSWYLQIIVEPEFFQGYSLSKKVFSQSIHDLEPIKVAGSKVEKFKYEHGDKCNI